MLARLCSAYEFLRSDDVIDRVDFIKWAATTKNDNGLLLAILERLDEIRRDGDVDEVLTRRETKTTSRPEPDKYRDKNLLGMMWQLLQDLLVDLVFTGEAQNYRDFEWGKLDPVRFVRVYKHLKQLESHVYNIHEASCLERISKPRILSRFLHTQSQRDETEMDREQQNDEAMVDWTILNVFLSTLAIATQIIFIVFIIEEIIDNLADKFRNGQVNLIVSNCVIASATISLFIGFVLENYVAANRATHVIQALRVRRAEYRTERLRRDYSLLLNLVGNGFLGYFLFWLNIPFILSAETVTDAILNSLATVFLLEIDDRIRPFQPTERFSLDMIDWDNDQATTNIIKLAHDYLYFKRDNRLPDQVEVTKVFCTFEETRDETLRHSFSPGDYCRIYVDDWDESEKDHRITVFRLAKEQMSPPVYEEFVYSISGSGAKEFITNVQQFHRIHRDESDSKNEFSRKRALRAFGQKRSKSVLVDVVESQKQTRLEYLSSMEDAEIGNDEDMEESQFEDDDEKDDEQSTNEKPHSPRNTVKASSEP